ncbi:uncharacterized protein LOC102720334 [Oryza brachyantha]|uniref:uncharacterized protein LOC102720334 n=1 Tax=Oryza brachyantha TaxID=4533 RepID=UPI0007764C6E|nr:uncharacterized protein LOC102720334 [Oryza brachyantha]
MLSPSSPAGRAPILEFHHQQRGTPCIGSMVADHICSVESGMIVESREVEKVVVVGESSAGQIVGNVGATMGGVMAGGVLKNSQPACCVDPGRSVPLSSNGAATIHREKTTRHQFTKEGLSDHL